MRHMDYEKFKEEYAKFKEYNMWEEYQKDDEFTTTLTPEGIEDLNEILARRKDVIDINRNWYGPKDMVNSPAHYTRGSQEVIDIIEQAISDAPSTTEGYLQGQALKYLLRVWLKDNPKQDCEKAVWYLNRLINKLD